MNKIVVNLDLHGGDFAPLSVIDGARIALAKHNNLVFRLHADQSTYNQYSKQYSDVFEISDWIECENFIPPEMKPSEALKKENRNSSMSNAISSLKDNKDQITVSAGNTGAMLAYSTIYLRTIENISRPAIASLFPPSYIQFVF